MQPDQFAEPLALLRRLNFSRAGSADDALPSDWGYLVHQLLAARSGHGPIPVSDPIALLASASSAAQRSNDQNLWMVLGRVTCGSAPSRG